MKVSFESEARETLYDIAAFIDSINTDGAGQFWVTNFILNVYTYAKPNVSYALCSHHILAQEGFSCFTYNGWVIAFKIEDDTLVVYLIIRGNLLA
ncbi:MAG TPA: hypothetical protein VG603_05490 [Chitinophagales bacterium]|nr:hypothetical protein [Chitinophagales bacterium]